MLPALSEDRPYRYYSAGELDSVFVRLSNKLRSITSPVRQKKIRRLLVEIDKERDRR